MNEYNASTCGERIAEVYNELYQELLDVQPIVDALAELANGDRVLELGISTGRIAVPLVTRGIDVYAIDA